MIGGALVHSWALNPSLITLTQTELCRVCLS